MNTALFHIEAISSGSCGNAYLIGYGQTQFLIDCGLSARTLCASLTQLGTAPEDLCAVFLTHEHIDHVRALSVLRKRSAALLYLAQPTAAVLGEAVCGRDIVFTIGETYSVGPFEITSFPLSHDSACCVGYRIVLTAGGQHRTLCFATDTGVVTPQLRAAAQGADFAILEANHDENMLLAGPYPYPLKRRILSECGHLSNESCASFCAELVAAGCRKFLLAHLSEENNYPALALQCVGEALREAGFSEGCEVAAAKPKETVVFHRELL